MKYTDGLYHVEEREFEYFGGYKQKDHCIVNVYGEPCSIAGKTLVFINYKEADDYCRRMNVCPEGAIFADLT